MLIIGCDFHTRYQQIAMAEDSTGELLLERRLDHQSGEADTFYRKLQGSPGATLVNASSSLGSLGALLPRTIGASEERIMVGSAVTE